MYTYCMWVMGDIVRVWAISANGESRSTTQAYRIDRIPIDWFLFEIGSQLVPFNFQCNHIPLVHLCQSGAPGKNSGNTTIVPFAKRVADISPFQVRSDHWTVATTISPSNLYSRSIPCSRVTNATNTVLPIHRNYEMFTGNRFGECKKKKKRIERLSSVCKNRGIPETKRKNPFQFSLAVGAPLDRCACEHALDAMHGHFSASPQ